MIRRMPNGDQVNFPDDMPEKQIQATIDKWFPNQKSPALGEAGKLASYPMAAAEGAAKGAVGDIVGLGQLAEDIPGVRSAIDAIPGLREKARGVANWSMTNDPNHPWASKLGRLVGSAVPIAAMGPELGIGALADAALTGGLTGFVQPMANRSEDWAHDILDRGEEAGYGALAGLGIGTLGKTATAISPSLAWLARHLFGVGVGSGIGSSVGHPWVGAALGNRYLSRLAPVKAGAQLISDAVHGAGEAITPRSTEPPWLNVRGGRNTGAPYKRTFSGPGTKAERMPSFVRKQSAIVQGKAGRLAPAEAGATVTQPSEPGRDIYVHPRKKDSAEQ